MIDNPDTSEIIDNRVNPITTFVKGVVGVLALPFSPTISVKQFVAMGKDCKRMYDEENSSSHRNNSKQTAI